MITLYTAGPMFGLPDASPFVTKADVLLKLSGLPYATQLGTFSKAPKRKVPYFDDDGFRFGDSTFLRLHLEEKYGVDFDKGLTPAERGVAWAFEKLAEDQLYWALVHVRWMDKSNFDKGPRHFFDDMPALIRPLLIPLIKRRVARALNAQGFGRHSKAEVERLAARSLDAIAAQLGDKPWLMGEAPCGADAAVWAMLAGALCPHFETRIRTDAARHANLVAYCDRGFATWYPERTAAAVSG